MSLLTRLRKQIHSFLPSSLLSSFPTNSYLNQSLFFYPLPLFLFFLFSHPPLFTPSPSLLILHYLQLFNIIVCLLFHCLAPISWRTQQLPPTREATGLLSTISIVGGRQIEVCVRSGYACAPCVFLSAAAIKRLKQDILRFPHFLTSNWVMNRAQSRATSQILPLGQVKTV